MIYQLYQNKRVEKVILMNVTGHIIEFTKYPSLTGQTIFSDGEPAEFNFEKCKKISDFCDQVVVYDDRTNFKVHLDNGYITRDKKLIMEVYLVYVDKKLDAIKDFFFTYKTEDKTDYQIYHEKLSNGLTIYDSFVYHESKGQDEVLHELVEKAIVEKLMTEKEASKYYENKLFYASWGVVELQCDDF